MIFFQTNYSKWEGMEERQKEKQRWRGKGGGERGRMGEGRRRVRGKERIYKYK